MYRRSVLLVLVLGVNMKIKALVVILLSVFSFQAHSVSDPGGFVEGKVERIFSNGSNVNFRIKGDGCKLTGSQGNTYWKFDMTSQLETKRSWYKLLLTAANTNKDIKVAVPKYCIPSQSQYVLFVYQDF